jgi:hypothetical protein
MPAATRSFRIGEVLSTEISRHKMFIKNLGKYDYDFEFKYHAYAVVVFKLLKGRTVSIYDFKLKYEGKLYKCIALRAGNTPFDTEKWQITDTDPKTVYSMLFILDSEAFGNAKKKVNAELVYALNNSGKINYELPFEFINYDELTSVDDIPQKGIFPEIKIDKERNSTGKTKK